VIASVKDCECELVRNAAQSVSETKVEAGEKYRVLNHVWVHGLDIHSSKALLQVPLVCP